MRFIACIKLNLQTKLQKQMNDISSLFNSSMLTSSPVSFEPPANITVFHII